MSTRADIHFSRVQNIGRDYHIIRETMGRFVVYLIMVYRCCVTCSDEVEIVCARRDYVTSNWKMKYAEVLKEFTICPFGVQVAQGMKFFLPSNLHSQSVNYFLAED